MKERKLTGNQMFEMVREECRRVLGKKKGTFFMDQIRSISKLIGLISSKMFYILQNFHQNHKQLLPCKNLIVLRLKRNYTFILENEGK